MRTIKTWLATIAALLCSTMANAITFDDWISTNKSHSSTSSHTYTFTSTGGSILSFDWSVSSEANYDKLIITLDGSTILEKSGSLNGTYTASLDSGEHTLVVKYTKDGSASNGSDEAKVFNLNITEPYTSNGISYGLNSDSTATILGFSEEINGALVIDSLLIADNITYKVSAIAESAFANCARLTSVTIPSSVGSIGNAAFRGCTSLNAVIIEDSDTPLTLGYNAGSQGLFYDCPIGRLYLGRNLSYNTSSSYGYSPFYGKATLASVNIGGKVTSISDYEFYGCTGITAISIPNSVSTVGTNTFYNCNGLTNLTVGNGVTSIGSNAFYGCTGALTMNSNIPSASSSSNGIFYNSKFTDVVIGDSVSTIGAYAFYGCNTITSALIKSGATSVGTYAFYGCTNLTDATIGNNVSSIGSYAFYGCNSLANIALGESITTIDTYAFYNCNKLATITIPGSVTSIGNYAFNGCSSLKNVVFENGGSTLALGYNGSNAGLFSSCPLETLFLGRTISYNTSYGYSPFYSKINLTSVVIGDSVTTVGAYAFYGCTGITAIKIPDNVKSIGSHAFYNCSAMKSATIGNRIESIGNYAFYGCTNLASIEIPNSVTSLGTEVFYDCNGLTEAIIGNGITSIGSYTFYGCTNLANVTIGNEVSTIGSYAFYNCNKLTSITIPKSVTSIDNYAFNGCDSLKSLTFEDGSATLSLGYNSYSRYGGNGLFYSCPLETLYLGRTLSYSTSSSYGYSPFYNKTTLTSVAISDSVKSIGSYAFYGCSSVSSISIPDGVTSIGSNAFYNCGGELYVNSNIPTASSSSYGTFYNSKFSKVIIGDNVTTIGAYAFYGCSTIKSIIIGCGINSIETEAFYNCNSIDSVSIKNTGSWCSINFSGAYANPLYYGHKLFIDEELVTEITIPEGVDKVGKFVFYNYEHLTKVSIPESASSIGKSAFNGCSNLMNVTMGSNVTTIDTYAFSKCSKLSSITIPKGVTSIGDYAFDDCVGLKDLIFEDNTTTLSIGYNGSNQALFYDCPLETIYLGRNLNYSTSSSYGYSPFYNKSTLKEVIIGNDVTSIGEKTFYNCNNLQTATIGNGVTTIGSYAFYGCSNLVELIIGRSVSNIGNYAFSGCNELWNIYALNPKAITCDESIFSADAYNNATLYAPIGRVFAYEKANPWSRFQIEPMEKYTITYMVDGEVYETKEVECATEIKLIKEPVMNGYTFSGWNGNPKIMPAKDITIFGTFTVNKYLITFKLGEEVLFSDSLDFGATINFPEVPKKSGYAFSGWDKMFSTMPAEDVVISGTYTRLPTEHITILDAETEFAVKDDMELETITYSRGFGDTQWQALYIPFEIAYEDICEEFEVAELNNVHQYDHNEDGATDETLIEAFKITSGTLAANSPYLIRAKEAGEKNIIVIDATLYATEENSIDCSSVREKFTFTGTYSRMSSDELTPNEGYYTLIDGEWQLVTEDVSLGAFRFYLKVDSRSGAPAAEVRSIRMRIIGENGEDDATGIDNLESPDNDGKTTVIYDLQGRKVLNTETVQEGVYIINGKKVVIK